MSEADAPAAASEGKTLTGHAGPVLAVAWSPDGLHVASADKTA